MPETVYEPARAIPVLEEPDVVVVGGGVAGCAAAWAAGKAGAKTMLLERNGCLGGVATATYMSNIGNMMITRDNTPVVGGIAAELLQRLVDAGAASPHWRDNDVPGCVIDSERLKLVLIEMLEEAGVTVLTHSVAASPVQEGKTVTGLIFEGKAGRQAVLAGMLEVVEDLGRAQQRLGRDAAPVQADAAEVLAVDDRRPEPELRRPDGGHVAARSGPDHDDVVGLGHCAAPSRARRRERRAGVVSAPVWVRSSPGESARAAPMPLNPP